MTKSMKICAWILWFKSGNFDNLLYLFYGTKIALDYWISIGEYVIDVININRTDVIIRWYRQISLT